MTPALPTFDRGTHTYKTSAGRVVGSTTEILRIAGLYDSYEFTAAIHKFRGGAVHHGAAIIDLHGEPELRIPSNADAETRQVADDIINGYWPAFRSFKARTGFQGRIWECPFVHETLGWGGTFDVVGECGAEVWMVDLKSGVMPEMVPVQLASYWELVTTGTAVDQNHAGLAWLKEIVASKVPVLRKAVRLTKDGKDTLFSSTNKGVSYDAPVWMAAWRSALNLYNLRERYNLL